MAVVAAACVKPTTFGTATCGGPLETTRSTALFRATCDPAVGDWLMTRPAATVVLGCVVIVPTVRLAFRMAVLAPLCVSPTTFGTVTGWPLETTSATALPCATCVPATGD